MAAPISLGSVELEKISQRGEFLGKKGWDRTPWTGAEPSTPSQGDWNWGKKSFGQWNVEEIVYDGM